MKVFIKTFIAVVCLASGGCMLRNVQLAPAHDIFHNVLRENSMVDAGIPLSKHNGRIGDEFVYRASKAEAAGLKQCSGCHR